MDTPVCKYLRSKKMFIPAHQAEALSEPAEPEADAFYWCNRTLSEIGSDDKLAHLCACVPGRGCFKE